MKILILANNETGLYRFRKELIKELVQSEYQVFVSLPLDKMQKDIEDLGCKTIPIKLERRGTNPIKDSKLLLQYIRLILRLKPDVVLTYTIKPNIYGGIACRLCNIPYIVNITGLGTAIENDGLLSKLLLVMYKIALKNASQVFFQNKNNKEFFNSKSILKGGKLIPGSGVNLEENIFETYPEEKEALSFLFVGRIMRDKGIEEFLTCAEITKKHHPGIRFSLVGGYDDKSYQARIEQLEELGIISTYGEQKDVHSFMKKHHAVILPSYHEGLSNVLLEASATGRPVLTTNIPGCSETFEEAVSGYGCEPRSAESLVQIVEKFIHLPYNDKERMGIRAREYVQSRFDRRLIIDEYMREINTIIGER